MGRGSSVYTRYRSVVWSSKNELKMNLKKSVKIVRLCLFAGAFIMSNLVFAQNKLWTLEECVDHALQNNLTIERARLNVETAEVNLKQARANRLPTLNANGSYGFNWGRSIDPTTNLFTTQRIASSNVGANSSVVLFNWFNIRNTVRQNEVNTQASRFDLQKAENDIILSVATFYLNIIFNKELLENAKSQLSSTERRVERTTKQVEVGALARTSLLDLLAQQATNELNVVNAENSLNFAILQLKQLLQIPASEPFDIEIPELEVGQEDLTISSEEVFTTAEQTMPEVKSADLGVESAALGLDVAKAGLYPTFRLGAGVNTRFSDAFTERFVPDGGFTTVDDDNDGIPDTRQIGFLPSTGEIILAPELERTGVVEDFGFGSQFDENLSQNVGLSVSIPIFNGLFARSSTQRAAIASKQAEITAQEVRNTLRQTIENAYNDVYAAGKSFQQSEKQVEALEESFRITEQRYDLQAVDFIDYQIANDNLFQAKSDRLRAKYDYIFKQKILDFYQGKQISFD